MKKRDILIIFLITLAAATLAGIIQHYVFAFIEPEKYTGDVSIITPPDITEVGESWHYDYEISAWAEPRDTYQIRIRWIYSYDNVNVDTIVGSESQVLTLYTKNFSVSVKCPSEFPPQLKGVLTLVELLGPEKRVVAWDLRWIQFKLE